LWPGIVCEPCRCRAFAPAAQWPWERCRKLFAGQSLRLWPVIVGTRGKLKLSAAEPLRGRGTLTAGTLRQPLRWRALRQLRIALRPAAPARWRSAQVPTAAAKADAHMHNVSMMPAGQTDRVLAMRARRGTTSNCAPGDARYRPTAASACIGPGMRSSTAMLVCQAAARGLACAAIADCLCTHNQAGLGVASASARASWQASLVSAACRPASSLTGQPDALLA
jgi:hypothetical protein